jgi:hypothetical protein
MRRVVDGETVSGHGKAPNFPELLVFDGIGPADGRLICSIESFHEASITLRPDGATELLIGHIEANQMPVSLTITNGIVLYSDGRAA